jgi:hypothetical protein
MDEAAEFRITSAMMSISDLFILVLAFALASVPFIISRLFGNSPLRRGKRFLIYTVESVLLCMFLAVITYSLAWRWGVEPVRRRRPEMYARAIRPSDRLSAPSYLRSVYGRKSDIESHSRDLCLSRNDRRISRAQTLSRRFRSGDGSVRDRA